MRIRNRRDTRDEIELAEDQEQFFLENLERYRLEVCHDCENPEWCKREPKSSCSYLWAIVVREEEESWEDRDEDWRDDR